MGAFHASLEALDAYLASEEPLGITTQSYFRDRLPTRSPTSGSSRCSGGKWMPSPGESYPRVRHSRGALGEEQPRSPYEFD